jgi:hypothetical protein
VDRFWKLLEESVIVQATITLIMVIAVTYMYVSGQEVPDALINFVALILGYYFGSKTQLAARR